MIFGGFALLAGAGTANAASVPAGSLPPLPDYTGDTSLTQQVDHPHYHYRRKHRHTDRSRLRHKHRYDRRSHGPRYKRRRPGFRFHFGGYWYNNPWWFYSVPRRHYGNRHIEWCLGRYRSYNPRTDMYLGYDGRYHYCRSPYR
jgi:hypothetical protein